MKTSFVVSPAALRAISSGLANFRSNDGRYQFSPISGLTLYDGAGPVVSLLPSCEVTNCGNVATVFSGEAGDMLFCAEHDNIQRAP